MGDIFHHLNALNLDCKGGIKKTFAARFNDLDMPKELLYFVRDPYTKADISPKAQEFLALLDIDEGALYMENIDMQASSDLKHTH